MLKITRDEGNPIPVLHFEGELLSESVSALKGRVRALAESESQPIVLDLSKVTFIDSVGVGAVIEMKELYKDTETPIRMFNVSPFVKKVLDFFEKKENSAMAQKCVGFSKNVEPAAM